MARTHGGRAARPARVVRARRGVVRHRGRTGDPAVSLPAVLAVDGGGSKIDVVLVARDGSVVGGARVRPPDGNGRDPSHSTPVMDAVGDALRDGGIQQGRQPDDSVGDYGV